MTVKEFLLHHTNANELCVICDNGYPISTVWIDHEDLFINYLNEELASKEVQTDFWDTLPFVDESNNPEEIECHCIVIT